MATSKCYLYTFKHMYAYINNTNVYTSLILKKRFQKVSEFKRNVILSSKTATRNIGLKKYI